MTTYKTTVRRAGDRGHADHGWLNSFHTFSFADYQDPKHMSFRALRVLNEDRVAPGQGFPRHSHSNMEIVSYVLEGALEHKDSIGTGSIIRPGDVQRMTAGTGVAHSEYNASKTEGVHFLQIWIPPAQSGLLPEYEQKTFSADEKRARFRLVASMDGREGSVTIHQDVALYATLLEPGEKAAFTSAPGRYAWLQICRGAITLDGERLEAGDGVAISPNSATDSLRIEALATSSAEVLLFDLP
jgi:redox-sensitive bicupin YhaK (pirin superfamily)